MCVNTHALEKSNINGESAFAPSAHSKRQPTNFRARAALGGKLRAEPVMTSILYLGVEGVLFPRSSQAVPRYQRENIEAHIELGLLRNIAEIVSHTAELSIVLNSWWVSVYGYRRLVAMLPEEMSSRTIGATTPGNRLHRKPSGQQTRLDILRADIRRRSPDNVTIVDASRSAIPFEYTSRAVLVDCLQPELTEYFSTEIRRMVSVSDSRRKA
jgi:hypothetical protein